MIREFTLGRKFVKRPGVPDRVRKVGTLFEAVMRDELEETHRETGPYWIIHRTPRPNLKPYSKTDSQAAWWLEITGRKA